MVQEYGIHVIPLLLMMGGKSWLDGVEIDPPAFYELLRTSRDFPKTSQPNVADFRDLFVRLAGEADAIVAVLVSGRLSGTIDSAASAAAELPHVPIEIIDSRREFLQALSGLTDPEAKRNAITRTFYSTVFGELVRKSGAKYLLHGTWLRPPACKPWSFCWKTCRRWLWWLSWAHNWGSGNWVAFSRKGAVGSRAP